MKNVPISTTIPIDRYEECKKNKWAFNELLLIGIEAKKNMPAMTDRLAKLEKAHTDSLNRIARLQNKVWALEQGVQE